jgi:hypothetical protein
MRLAHRTSRFLPTAYMKESFSNVFADTPPSARSRRTNLNRPGRAAARAAQSRAAGKEAVSQFGDGRRRRGRGNLIVMIK